MPEEIALHAAMHGSVRAVDRALDILLCFSRTEGGLTLSEISRQVQLHKSTVHRLLTSLQAKGFVRKDAEADKYVLGWSVLELLSSVYQSDELSTLALPEMTRLRDLTGETVSLYIRAEAERIRIQSVESHQPVRNVASIGKTYPLHIGASGKILLAYAEDDVLEQVLRGQNQEAGPVADRDELVGQLERIRRDRYAISIQERDAGAAAVAVPVFGPEAGLVAALAVSGPASRFTVTRMRDHLGTLQASATILAKLLSHANSPTWESPSVIAHKTPPTTSLSKSWETDLTR